MLSQQLNMLHSLLSRLISSLGTLADTLLQFLTLRLNLAVKSLKDRQNSAFECLGRLRVHVGNALRVVPDVIKHFGDTAQVLAEVRSLLQWLLNSL